MSLLIALIVVGVIVFALVQWYNYERVFDAEATVHLQANHEHFHFHVDMPDNLVIQPGDTLHILEMPEDDLDDANQTDGEITYTSPIRLYKASWLQRNLVKSSSLIEVTELIED